MRVIQAAVENYIVSCILVDNVSSVDMVFKKVFSAMKVEEKRVTVTEGPPFGFSGERKEGEGEGGVYLIVMPRGTTNCCRFIILDSPKSFFK